MINISDNTLTYLGEKEYKSAVWSCKSFQIQISEIKYIALSPRLALDDEVCFFVFIDKSLNLFKLPLFRVDNLTEIETFFKLENFNKFSYDNHYGKVDKIIYPKELFWKDLYHKDWKLFIRGFYSWIIPKSFFGNIIDYDN